MYKRILPIVLKSIVLLLVLLPLSPVRVYAQAGSASDLLAAVNAFRSTNGLAPYGLDGGMMSEAQAQSDYQASINTCTHTRADGSGPGDHGVSAENIACGYHLSVDAAIYSQWTDALHNATMLGPDTGLAGAGMATSGDNVYYTLDVKRLTGEFTYRPPRQSQDQPTSAPRDVNPTPVPKPGGLATVIVSTPSEDGSIAHTIHYGETLVDIAAAYGISLDDLYKLNKDSIDPKKPVYFEGQVLTIRLAQTQTPTLAPTFTLRPPTRTKVPTRTATALRTSTPTSTVTITPTPTLPVIDSPNFNRTAVAYGFIVVSAVGLVFVVVKGFVKGKQ